MMHCFLPGFVDELEKIAVNKKKQKQRKRKAKAKAKAKGAYTPPPQAKVKSKFVPQPLPASLYVDDVFATAGKAGDTNKKAPFWKRQGAAKAPGTIKPPPSMLRRVLPTAAVLSAAALGGGYLLHRKRKNDLKAIDDYYK